MIFHSNFSIASNIFPIIQRIRGCIFYLAGCETFSIFLRSSRQSWARKDRDLWSVQRIQYRTLHSVCEVCLVLYNLTQKYKLFLFLCVKLKICLYKNDLQIVWRYYDSHLRFSVLMNNRKFSWFFAHFKVARASLNNK